MQQSEAFHRELRATYARIVAESFARAHHCLGLARQAHQAGDCAEVRRWIWCVRVSRMAAAEWRRRARRIAPLVVCFFWCLVGCAKSPAREVTVDFNVQPSRDGTAVMWTMTFNRTQYHAMLDSTSGADLNTRVHSKVRALIRAGLESHQLSDCRATEQFIAKLSDGGIAFVGSCSVAAHPVPAGGQGWL